MYRINYININHLKFEIIFLRYQFVYISIVCNKYDNINTKIIRKFKK